MTRTIFSCVIILSSSAPVGRDRARARHSSAERRRRSSPPPPPPRRVPSASFAVARAPRHYIGHLPPYDRPRLTPLQDRRLDDDDDGSCKPLLRQLAVPNKGKIVEHDLSGVIFITYFCVV